MRIECVQKKSSIDTSSWLAHTFAGKSLSRENASVRSFHFGRSIAPPPALYRCGRWNWNQHDLWIAHNVWARDQSGSIKSGIIPKPLSISAVLRLCVVLVKRIGIKSTRLWRCTIPLCKLTQDLVHNMLSWSFCVCFAGKIQADRQWNSAMKLSLVGRQVLPMCDEVFTWHVKCPHWQHSDLRFEGLTWLKYNVRETYLNICSHYQSAPGPAQS